ncbi:MAG TPA: threonine-phosphate decarboxylase CobD [Hyphomicrobiales bacterium]|nr:threonine-phosphate decarboxylase CobD [Hyphomicrobiales bacterium]
MEELDQRFLEHGGRLDVARAAYPSAPEPWIDLSTGISPWTYPAPPISPEALHSLPSPGALQRLADIAHKAYRAPFAAQVVPLPGSDAGLSVLPWLFRTPKRVAVLAPAYSGHAAAWAAAGHSVAEIAGLDGIGSAAILIAVNPNNPDGRLLHHAELAKALTPLRRRDGLLIVDEAFADADESHSVLPLVAKLDYTIVLRSLSKFYGAGGIRLGFGITSHPVAARLKAALGAWPLSAQAIAFGSAALSDEPWAASQRARLRGAAQALDLALENAGLTILGGTALFRLAAHRSAACLFVHLARSGILVRPFRNRPWLRFGLPAGEEEKARLTEALRSAPLQKPGRS